MNDDMRKQILAEVLEMTKGEPIADDEFTVRDFATLAGLSRRQAADKLSRLVDDDKLEKRLALIDGAWQNVYKKI